jgi:hypothetical protein
MRLSMYRPQMFRSRPPPDGTLRAKVAAAAGDLAEYSPLEGEEPGHGELAAVPLDVQVYALCTLLGNALQLAI